MFFNDLIFSLRFVSLIFGILLVYLFYLIGREVYSGEAGLFASFFVATNYSFIVYSQEVGSIMMYLFFSAFIFFLYFKLEKKFSFFSASLLGVSIGILYLIRPEGLALLFLPVVLFIDRRKRFGLRNGLLGFILPIVFCLAVMAPYVYFLYQNTGEITFSKKANSNLMHGMIFNGEEKSRLDKETYINYEKIRYHYDEETNSMTIPDEFRNLNIRDSITRDATPFLNRFLRGFESEIIVLLIDHGAVLLLLTIIATCCLIARRSDLRKDIAVLSMASAIYLVIFPIFHVESRYLLEVMVFIILIASFGYAMTSDRIYRIRGVEFPAKLFLKGIKLILIGLISINFLVSVFIYFSSAKSNDYDYEYKIAGEYIKNNSEFGSNYIIMSRSFSLISFYADAEHRGIGIPYTSVENILKYARANKANYIVVDERGLAIRDNYDDLKNMQNFSDDIELVFSDNSVADIRIFKVLDR
ncbi:MAG: glycosyltransferase family 39 protein [Minisyncoccia bacterium]